MPCAALVAWLVLTACGASSKQHDEVVLLGDSIAEETAPYLRELVRPKTLLDREFGGTAPCDWLDKDLFAKRGRTVVVSFTGNSLTPCMRGSSGDQLRGQALVDKYRSDLTALVTEIRRAGAEVLLVGQPERGPAASDGASGRIAVSGLNDIYEDLATNEGVSFVDAGATVETADGAFTTTLPCAPGEAQCGPDGRNAVRSEDGVHLCPVRSPSPCAVYASGAFRFARAIAAAIIAR